MSESLTIPTIKGVILIEEVWKHYIYIYSVSNLGKVRNDKTNKILKSHINNHGYSYITLSFGNRNKVKKRYVHRLVAYVFIPNPNNKPQVNHKDGNKMNNNLENLEWCTQRENTIHAYKTGLYDINSHFSGINNVNSKLSEENIIYIRNKYKFKDKNYGSIQLGKMFNVTHTTILNIVKNKSYNNIKG